MKMTSDNEKVQDPVINKDVDFNAIMGDAREQLVARVMLDKRISRRVIQCIPICSKCKHPYDINLDGSDLPVEIGKFVTVKCPNCGTEYEISTFRSRDPNAQENIIYNGITTSRNRKENEEE